MKVFQTTVGDYFSTSLGCITFRHESYEMIIFFSVNGLMLHLVVRCDESCCDPY